MNGIKQYSTVATGTITAQDTKQDIMLVHNAAALASTLTIAFPATPIDGQIFGITSALGITALTISGGTTTNSISTMAAGSYAT